MTKPVRFWRDPQGSEYMSADVKGSRFVYTSWYVWTLFGWEPIEVPSEETRHTFADITHERPERTELETGERDA
jgi:hypothetical protein